MSWDQLKNILDENREVNRTAKQQPPAACPVDGTILEERRGVWNCPLGNYTWSGGRGVASVTN